MKNLFSYSAIAVLAFAMGFTQPARSAEAERIQVPAGTYVLEKTHASLTWRIKHLGMSNYTARFKTFDATIKFDPADFSKSSVQASIDVASLETDFVPVPGRDFNTELRGADFFNAAKFPKATFVSRQVSPTGPRSMRVLGDLTLLGSSQPVTLDVTLNGSLPSHPFAKVAALGFSARGQLQRTAYGLNPPPIQQGVADAVEILIEAEFIQQP